MWWPETGSNRRRRPFQGRALPLSYLALGIQGILRKWPSGRARSVAQVKAFSAGYSTRCQVEQSDPPAAALDRAMKPDAASPVMTFGEHNKNTAVAPINGPVVCPSPKAKVKTIAVYVSPKIRSVYRYARQQVVLWPLSTQLPFAEPGPAVDPWVFDCPLLTCPIMTTASKP